MKAISLENLFGLKSIDWQYNGWYDEFKHNGLKYLPLETVKKYYMYREAWVEEIDIDED